MKSYESGDSSEKIKIKKSRTILGLSPNKKYSIDELKKKYRIAALKHHPDKHFNSDDSNAKFKEINEAYLYLHGKYSRNDQDRKHGTHAATSNANYENENENENDKGCYSNLFSNFMNSLMCKFSKTQVATIRIIVEILMNKCATISATMFDQMDRESLLFIYNLTVKYHTILEISIERLNIIMHIMKLKLQENDIIIIHPSISDLFDKNNIQVIEHETKIYYVPLWHTELYYLIQTQNKPKLKHEENEKKWEQAQERELIVKCIPKLPEYIYIDEANNIYIDVRTRVENLFNQKKLTISFTESISFDIPIHTLEFKTHQTVTLKRCGIPAINIENVYDVSEKRDVIIHLEILLS